jgi:hypothetical protein
MNYLIGHLVGDYLLQTKWMAYNKKLPGRNGWLACLTHCSLWTLSVMLFTGWWKLDLALCVFLSHLVLDRTHFVAWFLKVMHNDHERWLLIVTDNTIHLLFLWLIARLLTYQLL